MGAAINGFVIRAGDPPLTGCADCGPIALWAASAQARTHTGTLPLTRPVHLQRGP
jgi:hypothetical protein